MPKITVIGTTTWGLTLGIVLAREKHQVTVWREPRPRLTN